MAQKRCFNQKITESDSFLEMPISAQCLYFHLNMYADDDGFVNSPKKVMRMVGCNEDDLKLLIAKSFILVFDSGIIVIKHWRMHNTLQNDRYHPTDYQEEYALLGLKDNKSYTWKQNGNILETEHNITKHNITKHNSMFTPPTTDEVKAYCLERNNNVDYERFVDFYSSKGWMVGKNKMKDWKACVRTWERDDKPKETKERYEMDL